MKKYLVNTKNMSLDEKILSAIDKIPYILLDINKECSEDIYIVVPQVCEYSI